jgi:hypothetical protein
MIGPSIEVWTSSETCRRSNVAILAATRYRIAASRRRLNRAFGMSGSSDTEDVVSRAPTPLIRPENPLLREKARQAIERKRMPNREPDRLGGVAGVGHMCSVCERPVTTMETDLELIFARDGTPGSAVYHVHVRCYSAWARTLQDNPDGLARNR